MASKPLILVVEDEPDIRALLSTAIKMWQYESQMAHNAFAALGYLELRRPDLILLDLMLPGMTGEQFIANCSPEERTIPIVVMTAHAAFATLERLWSLGVKQVVSKPFSLVALKAAVDECLGAIYRQSQPK